MISKKIEKALQGSSAIRAMFVEGKQMAENMEQRMFMIFRWEIRQHRLRRHSIRQLRNWWMKQTHWFYMDIWKMQVIRM